MSNAAVMRGVTLIGPAISSDKLSESVSTSATAHTRGNWVELLASSPCEMSGFHLQFRVNSDGIGDGRFSFEIGTGIANSEVIRVQGIGGVAVSYRQTTMTHYIPLRIQRGQRVAVRVQSSYAAVIGCPVGAQFQPQTPWLPRGFDNCVALGFDQPNTTGLSVVNGYNGGTPLEFSSGLPYPVRAVSLTWWPYTNNATAGIEVLTGAIGSELVRVPKVYCGAGFSAANCAMAGPFAVTIPPSIRIALKSYGPSTTYEQRYTLLCWY